MMTSKLVGAILIMGGCGGCGFQIAAAHKKDELDLRRLISALDFMECELRFRGTPLPQLCRMAGQESRGCIREVLMKLASNLEYQIHPQVNDCMQASIKSSRCLSVRVKNELNALGQSLGRFDLEGQIQGLQAVRDGCRRSLSELTINKDSRLRCYQTLGLCAGAALAILFI